MNINQSGHGQSAAEDVSGESTFNLDDALSELDISSLGFESASVYLNANDLSDDGEPVERNMKRHDAIVASAMRRAGNRRAAGGILLLGLDPNEYTSVRDFDHESQY